MPNGTNPRALPLKLFALLAALVLALGAAACGDDDGDTEEPAAQGTTEEGSSEEEQTSEEDETDDGSATALTVTAREYEFDFPATLEAGPVEITLQNEGEQPHHLILAKLSEDAPPIEELIEMPNPEKFLAEDITGNNPPHANPGQTAKTTIETELTPGTYGYVCFIPDKEKKKPHALLGMNGTFEVE